MDGIEVAELSDVSEELDAEDAETTHAELSWIVGDIVRRSPGTSVEAIVEAAFERITPELRAAIGGTHVALRATLTRIAEDEARTRASRPQ